MVKLNNELIKVLSEFRKGKIEESEIELDKVEGFDVQKNLIKAQLNYFKEDHENAMRHDEKALPNNDQWYAGNILCEHFFAYSNSAIQTNQIKRATKFYNNYLANKKAQNLPEHKINFYNHQITQHLKKIKGEKGLMIDYKPYEINENGKPIENFYEQYKHVHGKSDFESKDAVGYILYFLIQYGNTEECLNYYENNWESAIIEDNHLKIAQVYRAKGQIDKTKEVILRFASKFWLPIEHLQIVPMKLFQYEDLMEIMDKEIKSEILKTDKEKR